MLSEVGQVSSPGTVKTVPTKLMTKIVGTDLSVPGYGSQRYESHRRCTCSFPKGTDALPGRLYIGNAMVQESPDSNQ